MIDLDEREQRIDEALRLGGTNLRAAARSAAIPPQRTRRHAHRRGWVVASLTAIAVIVGLLEIGTNRGDQTPANDPARLRWIVSAIPSGLKAESARGPEGSNVSEPGTLNNLYATSAAPLGPVLLVAGSGGNKDFEISPGSGFGGETDITELTIDGRRAAFATSDTGLRILYVEASGHWLELMARNIDDATLTRLGQSATWNGDGTASIPTPKLIAGLELVSPAGAPFDAYRSSLTGQGSTDIFFTVADGSRALDLTVAEPTVLRRALVAWGNDLQPTTIGSTPGYTAFADPTYVFPPTTYRILYWERDGLAFRLSGNNVNEGEMMAAALSVRPATVPEWDALSLLQSADGVAPAPAATEVPGTGVDAPSDTIPTFAGGTRDVDLDVTVADTSLNRQVWSGTLPTGENWSVDITRVYDSVSITGDVAGQGLGSYAADTRSIPSTGYQQTFAGTIITADPRASAMRVVRSNGDRYTILIHDLPGSDRLRVAAIALPQDSPAQQVDVVDAGGNVIEPSP